VAGGTWKNHGDYVAQVVVVAEAFADAGLITPSDQHGILAAAAQSACGRQ
jgi:hypothetical protein